MGHLSFAGKNSWKEDKLHWWREKSYLGSTWLFFASTQALSVSVSTPVLSRLTAFVVRAGMFTTGLLSEWGRFAPYPDGVQKYAVADYCRAPGIWIIKAFHSITRGFHWVVALSCKLSRHRRCIEAQGLNNLVMHTEMPWYAHQLDFIFAIHCYHGGDVKSLGVFDVVRFVKNCNPKPCPLKLLLTYTLPGNIAR